MDDLMWWFDARFYYQFFLESIVVSIYVFYLRHRIKKVLGESIYILSFVNKTFRYLNIVLLFFLSFFILFGIIGVVSGDINIIAVSGPVLFYISFVMLHKKANGFNFNDTGIVIPTVWDMMFISSPLRWSDIDNVKWDKDINQTIYGFYIYSSTFKPLRLWVERKNMDEMKGLFDKYNVPNEQDIK
ncbi:hypothetical protein ACFLSQ_09265 [Bacteroidota bacterium]